VLYDSFGGGRAEMIGASYALDGFSVGVTYERDGDAEIAATYTMDGFTISAGASNGDAEYRTVRVGYAAGDFTVGLIGTQYGGNDLITVGGSYNLGDMGTFGAYAGDHAGNTVGGVSYRYSLGGGATIGAAIERLSNGNDSAEAGVVFSF